MSQDNIFNGDFEINLYSVLYLQNGGVLQYHDAVLSSFCFCMIM